jgi:hypothetical protein
LMEDRMGHFSLTILSSSKKLCVKAPPNPSIERTSPGKPGTASHVKR